MTPERHAQLGELFHQAREMSAERRAEFLRRACAKDAALQREVESLLAADDEATGFIAMPAIEIVDAAYNTGKTMAAPPASSTIGSIGLKAGDRLGPYDVVERIGSGGMGDVYRAHDSRLRRDVAIKVSRFPLGERFEREARAIAALNHANVCAVYDVGPSYLVMELVDGDTLADRLASGPIPWDQALVIARQIAEAIESAHEHGIIHRDLKPGNIKLRPDRTVKVLDFGVAKVLQPISAGVNDVADAETFAATDIGAVVGTAAYMSPEQAAGSSIDRRADIWAFGCVLFEMLSARQAFGGSSRTETLGQILNAEPAWNALPPHTPDAIRRVLQRCLHKDLRARFHDIADVRIALEDFQSTPLAAAPAPAAAAWRDRVLWAGAAAVMVLAAAGAVFTFWPADPELAWHFDIVTPPEGDMVSLAVSPDGNQMVFAGLQDNEPYLWLRSLRESPVPQRLDGTGGASMPFWSPDNKSLGFFAEGHLKRIDLATGTVQTLATTTAIPTGGTWNRDGTILYSPGFTEGIFQVRARPGGRPAALPRAADGMSPRFLPDGRHFLFQVGPGQGRGIYIGSLDGSVRHKLAVDGTSPEFAPRGQLLYIRNGTLFTRRFDPERFQDGVGEEIPVADRVAVSPDALSAAFSAGGAGVLAYRALAPSDPRPRRLVWFNRRGDEIASVGELSSSGPALSPNERLIVMDRNIDDQNDIWLLENARLQPLTRFTAGGALTPVIAPGGRTVAFSYQNPRNGNIDLYRVSVDGGTPEPLLESPASKAPTDWTRAPDGQDYLLFRNRSSAADMPNRGLGIWAVATSVVNAKAFPVVDSEFEERDGVFSPDAFSAEARWVAYESNRSGRTEIYVHPFQGPGREQPISTTGGTQARWSRDGRELFYIARDGYLMAVPIRLGIGDQIEVGNPQRLFRTRVGASVPSIRSQQYVVSKDGQRFLMSVVPEQSLTPIRFTHWPSR